MAHGIDMKIPSQVTNGPGIYTGRFQEFLSEGPAKIRHMVIYRHVQVLKKDLSCQ